MLNIKISGAIAPNGQHIPSFISFTEAALYWHQFGFDVIPIVPLLKRPAVTWNAWLDALNAEKIASHWAKHPNHEVGFIVGDSFLVLDADSPTSVDALHALERKSGVPPLMVVTTRRGEHHYFGREPGTFAKSDAFSTEQHPDRIDVKTGRSIVVLPPSTGKTIKACWVAPAAKLFKVEQDFIDTVFQHNGREAPRPPVQRETAPSKACAIDSKAYGQVAALLKHIDPEEGGHDAWVRVGMAIHAETEGSNDGLDLFDQWSSAGATYPGRRSIEVTWRSFISDREDRCNRGTLINRVKAAGHDWMAICSAEEEPFEQCEGEVVYPDGTVAEPVNSTRADTGTSNPLEQYSLLGKTAEIEKLAIEEKHLLGRLAVLGQLTVFYAAPNTGKTLIVLFLLMDAIRQGRINASKVFYINVDDTLNALLQKLNLADESGFHMLAEGHEEFKVTMFVKNLEEMIANDQATGIVIILDTIKRFTELMDKKRVSQFTQLCRRFTMKGGTLIALAHANKHPGADGKPIYAGTSDVVDDFDCAYTIAPLSKTAPGNDKVVVFENIKRRGNVELRAAYSYSDKIEQSYNALLASVQEVDDVELLKLNVAEPSIPDTVIVDAIIECICQGINTRMALAREAANRAGVSRRKAMQVIERYTGLEPLQHKWLFTVGDRGANVFSLLAITAKP